MNNNFLGGKLTKKEFNEIERYGEKKEWKVEWFWDRSKGKCRIFVI